MAHVLEGYDGLCANMHGHSYILSVTVIGKPIEQTGNPKLGMVMDFGDLKKIVKKLTAFFGKIILKRNKFPVHTGFCV